MKNDRIAYFDNAKLLLIFLVALGHMIVNAPIDVKYAKVFDAIYEFIYLFHMPAFIFLSGYFSKNFSRIPARILKFAILYLVLHVLYALAFGFPDKQFLVKPSWTLWFLLSLVCWNAILPLFTKTKWSILLALMISVMVGYFDGIGEVLSLSRMFVFFPFFLAGYFVREDNFAFLTSRRVRLGSAVFMLFAFAVCLFWQLPIEWLYGRYGYGAMGVTVWYAGLFRLCATAASAAMCAAFLSLVPRRRFPISYMGGYTLDAYLVHGFFIRWGAGSGVYQALGLAAQMAFTVAYPLVILTVLLNARKLLLLLRDRTTNFNGDDNDEYRQLM